MPEKPTPKAPRVKSIQNRFSDAIKVSDGMLKRMSYSEIMEQARRNSALSTNRESPPEPVVEVPKSMPPEIPFQHTYWVLPGKLLAGACPGTVDPAMAPEHIAALADTGVTLVINLMQASETKALGTFNDPYETILPNLGKERGRDIRVERFSIADRGIPTAKLMASILDTIRRELDASGVVYVHCMGGIGRTGTVIGCLLAEHGHPEPLEHLRALTAADSEYFWPTPQTEAQRDFVVKWAAVRREKGRMVKPQPNAYSIQRIQSDFAKAIESSKAAGRKMTPQEMVAQAKRNASNRHSFPPKSDPDTKR